MKRSSEAAWKSSNLLDRLRRSFAVAYGSEHRGEAGNALIEAAILMPLIGLLVCGAMDFSRVIYAGIAMAGAARAGVQYGTFSPGNAGDINGMNQAARNDAAGQGFSSITVSSRNFCGCVSTSSEVSCSTGSCSGATPSGYVSTTAAYTFTTVVRYPGIPNSIRVSRTAKMRVQ
ncbi:MAG: pilus assembly protein [Acidobacteria bacterium]|nr:pilus assembly protein [Acidobacteriota bacterium]